MCRINAILRSSFGLGIAISTTGMITHSSGIPWLALVGGMMMGAGASGWND